MVAENERLATANDILRQEIERLKASLGDAASPDPPPPATVLESHVGVSFTVQGLDYDMLTKEPQLREEFEQRLRTEMAKQAGVTLEALEVKLSKGSVKVETIVRSWEPEVVHGRLVLSACKGQGSELREALQKIASETPGIAVATIGPIAVGVVEVIAPVPTAVGSAPAASSSGPSAKPAKGLEDIDSLSLDLDEQMDAAVGQIYEDLHNQNRQLRTHYGQLQSEYTSLRGEREQMKEMLTQLCHNLEGVAMELRSTVNDLNVPPPPKSPCLESENSQLKEVNTALCQEILKMRKENDSLQKELSQRASSRALSSEARTITK
jgi:regulator of replication initiation timing